MTNREEGFDRDSLKCRITTVRLEQQLPRWQPNPQDSPSSNRKHLFRSDNSAECLWGPSLWDIKRIRKKDVGRERVADRERGRPRRDRQEGDRRRTQEEEEQAKEEVEGKKERQKGEARHAASFIGFDGFCPFGCGGFHWFEWCVR